MSCIRKNCTDCFDNVRSITQHFRWISTPTPQLGRINYGVLVYLKPGVEQQGLHCRSIPRVPVQQTQTRHADILHFHGRYLDA